MQSLLEHGLTCSIGRRRELRVQHQGMVGTEDKVGPKHSLKCRLCHGRQCIKHAAVERRVHVQDLCYALAAPHPDGILLPPRRVCQVRRGAQSHSRWNGAAHDREPARR